MTDKGLATIVLCLGVVSLAPTAFAAEITVDANTGRAIEQAIEEAEAGDTIELPAGDYRTSDSIVVDKAVTLVGAAQLEDVAVPEWEGEVDDPPTVDGKYPDQPLLENEPPTWSGTPTTLEYGDRVDYDMFVIEADGVRFEHIQFHGAIDESRENMPMRQNGIYVEGADFVMDNCEMTRFPQALTMDDASAQNVRVRDSYFHENLRTGSSYGVRATGGASVDVQDSEFHRQRHGVVGNSRDTHIYVANNYFVNDDRVWGAYDVDMHPYGRESARSVIRDNIFRNVAPIVVMSGSAEITGNYFDAYVEDWNPPVLIKGGYRSKHSDTALPHDIYVGENNDQTSDLVDVWPKSYGGTTKWAAYNVFHDGQLWEASHTKHPPRDSNPRPFVGNAWVSEADGDDRVTNLGADTWYDLHIMAVDPQGADDLAELGIQIVDTARYEYRADHQGGVYRPEGDYYIQATPEDVRVRQSEGTDDFESVDGRQGTYVDASQSGRFAWRESGDHRVHLTVRFRLPEEAAESSDWRIFAYAEDADGHRPRPAWYDSLEGWPFTVGEGDQSGDDDPPEDDDERLTLSAPKVDQPIEVDGELDEAAYTGAEPLRFTDQNGVSENEVTVRAVWDEYRLVVAYSVDDDELTVDDRELYHVDGVELFLDTLRDRGRDTGPDDYQWIVSMEGEGALGSTVRDEDLEWQYEATEGGGGFDLEIAVPWSEIDVDPEVDLRTGLLLANNDLDGETLQQFSFTGTSSFHIPSRWGDLVLQGPPEPSEMSDAGMAREVGTSDSGRAETLDAGPGGTGGADSDRRQTPQRSSDGCASTPGAPVSAGWWTWLAILGLGLLWRRR